ncbi:flavodoxin [Clostridium estertheticum]|uniref:flavodoxin n=1 Tax=Clostridium estertheticum TaxID=238834 RepID=UPI0013EE914B|nr:flavodoxin [Clostridium estertheticum]MBZ9608670.1 flavodoxin [Clostridium estertheticum]
MDGVKQYENEAISRHERDLKVLSIEKKLLMKRLAEIECEMLQTRQFNREMKGRENDGL